LFKRTIWGAAGAAAALLAAVAATPAAATGLSTVALYQMNEAAGATTLVDSSGNGIDGIIGKHVVLNGQMHDFPFHKGWAGGTVDPEHQDLVANDELNPGTRAFSFSLRLRIRHDIGNILQKGQSGTAGGMWALKLDDGQGRVLCQYRAATPSGGGAVWSSNVVADGQWHVVTCARQDHRVSVTVDGVTTTNYSGMGDITNKLPLSIGGKSRCQAVPGFDCDYFDGQIDWLRVETVLPDGGSFIAPGRVTLHNFYPYRRDGYRDRVGFLFRAGLHNTVPGGANIRIEIWNQAKTRLVRHWTFHTDDASVSLYRVRWAGRNDHGRLVKPGIYRIHAAISVPNAPSEAPKSTLWRTVRARRGPKR
jgi:hypothetical protein